MQWGKAKTIMIWVFLIVDILLFAIYMSNRVTIGNEDNKKLIGILENNNVSIKEELLDIENENVFAHEFTGLTLTPQFVSYFFDEPVKINNNTYESSDKTAFLSFNSGYLTYENKKPKAKGFGNVDEKNVNSKLGGYLKKLGVNKYTRLLNVFSKDGDIYAEYSYFFDEKELFSSKLTFKVNKNGVSQINGNINIPNNSEGYNFMLSDIKTILFDFVRNNTFSHKETVVSITEGYYCINYENTLYSQAIPVYRIKTADKVYIYDARLGIEAEKRQLWSK